MSRPFHCEDCFDIMPFGTQLIYKKIKPNGKQAVHMKFDICPPCIEKKLGPQIKKREAEPKRRKIVRY